MRRTQKQWAALVEEQKHSGLTATAFCKTKGLNPKYFSLRKSRLSASPNKNSKGSFVRLNTECVSSAIQIRWQDVCVTLPSGYPVKLTVELIRALKNE